MLSVWHSFCAVFSFEGANSFSSPFSALLLLLTELISNRTFLGTGKSVASIQIYEKTLRQSQDSPHKDGDLSHCAPPSAGGGLLTWVGVAHRPSLRWQTSALADWQASDLTGGTERESRQNDGDFIPDGDHHILAADGRDEAVSR